MPRSRPSPALPAAARRAVEVASPDSGRARIDAWFRSRDWTPWPFQIDAWDAYAQGRSGLIQVGTGAGKTYAAFLGPLAGLIDAATGQRASRSSLRVLYITPLRAVSRDIELALKEPITELDLPFKVESRTGDTSSAVRARQRERLPHILVTTPESLSLLLTRENARELFADLAAVIVDEWHELLGTKRGTQTELALARLRRFAPSLRTWALSATLPNLSDAAKAIAGVGTEPCIVRGDMLRPVSIDAVLPHDGSRLPWAGHLGLSMLDEVLEALAPPPSSAALSEAGVLPACPPSTSCPSSPLATRHSPPDFPSTLVFTNTRSQAERWFHAISWRCPQWNDFMALHHGSIDRAERERIERGLKSGDIRLVVATSSLDLGVDFAPVERVFQIGSPKGIARLVQRAGRSSHRPRTPCRVTCVPTHMLELVEIAAARNALSRGDIEARPPIDKPLDVLAQHLVTCAIGGGFTPDDLFAEVRTAHAYRDLTEQEFTWALALVEKGGGTLEAYPDFRRIAPVDGVYRITTPRHAQLHRFNVGTITGDGSIEIRYLGGKSLGRIEEHFVSNLREGERFVFAGKVLTLVMYRDLVAYVRPARGTTKLTPIWGGTRLPISESLSHAIRQVLHEEAQSSACSAGSGNSPPYVSPELLAARDFLTTQLRESAIPSPDETLAEITRTRDGTHLFLFPFEGRLVHSGLAALLALRLARLHPATFSLAVNDYGLELLCPDDFDFATPLTSGGLFTRAHLAADALDSVNMSQLARLQFREIARVAGLVFQSTPGRAKTSRQLQTSSGLIYDVLAEFDPDNLLLAQARSEVLTRHFESGRLARTLDRLASGGVRIVHTRRPTPLSFPLVVERLAGRLSTETLAARVDRMRRAWMPPEIRSTSRSTSPGNPSS